ncbi:hypothetical protein R8G64_00625 [Tenacibaculum maritimum]
MDLSHSKGVSNLRKHPVFKYIVLLLGISLDDCLPISFIATGLLVAQTILLGI